MRRAPSAQDGSVRADHPKASISASLTRNDPPCQHYVAFGLGKVAFFVRHGLKVQSFLSVHFRAGPQPHVPD